jgi:Flp pilus assembly protein TadB
MLKRPLYKFIALYLIIAIIILSTPAQGWAMFIPSGEAASVRHSEMAAIQKTLESSVIKQRLSDYGLSSEEALAKINQLSQEQIHQLAANLDSLQAGADGVDALIFLLLVAIIVVVVLQVTGHRVIVK